MQAKRKHAFAFTILFVSLVKPAFAETCYPPERPFVPENLKALREYERIIAQDFESYISRAQAYFRCLEDERARAFSEAQEVTRDYVRFFESIENAP